MTNKLIPGVPEFWESDTLDGPRERVPDDAITVTIPLGELRRLVAEAYIPAKMAIELSNGVLNRRKLDKAIQAGEVRHFKPTPQRLMVYLADFVGLVNRLMSTEKASEPAMEMFSLYAGILRQKQTDPDLR